MLNYEKLLELENRNFVPEEIIGREEEKKWLDSWSRNPHKENLLITSYDSGTGKTTIVKWFFKNKLKDYKTVHVLCRDTETNHSTFKAIGEDIELKTGIKLEHKKTHYDIVKYMKKVLSEGNKIIVCLDELDYLINNEKNDNLLCSLLHIQEEKLNGELIFILISNDYWIRKNFSHITLSRLGENMIPFDKYKVGEGAEILKYYIKIFGLLNKEYLPNDNELVPLLINFIKKIPSSGDMRKIIKSFIIWVKKCDEKLDPTKLDDSFFYEIMQIEIYKLIDSMAMEEKTILLSLFKSEIDSKDFSDAKEKGKKMPERYYRTTFNRFYNYYNEICKKTNIKPLKKRRFKHYLYELINKKRVIDVCRFSYGRGRGMRGFYTPSNIFDDYFDNVIEKILTEFGISRDYIYNTKRYELIRSSD